MDRNLVKRLRADKAFRGKICKLARDYAALGTNSVGYWTGEFDVAHDLLQAYSPLTKKDFENLEKGHPRRFLLPMAATQITTMATFISQMLFGGDTPHRVDGRGPEDEKPAEFVNSLLRWNSEQQPQYLLGYLWVADALVFNRGIFYNSWSPIMRGEHENVQIQEQDEEGNDMFDEAGQPVYYSSSKIVPKKVGGFVRYTLISPYDWFCDPSVPLWRLNEGRFCGHRFKRPWTELERRSRLDPDDPEYVLPEAVAELKKKKRPVGDLLPMVGSSPAIAGTRSDTLMSRSQYERQRSASPLVNDAANKDDPGTVECVELWVRLTPKDHGLGDSTDSTVFQITVGSHDTVLAINESVYTHLQYPYSVAEGRPSGHYQFSPSWAFLLKGLQDHVDYLKNRHQEALQRTVGNVFVADPTMVELDDFLNPDKEGLIIQLKPAAYGRKISEVIQQIPIKDMTEGFQSEMETFINYAENVTGANNYMQGAPGGSDSATEFAGVQQMSAGRLSSVARLISVQGLVPQTRQTVALFQQFLETPQLVRYTSDPMQASTVLAGAKALLVTREEIQGEFDFIAHDGSLPGTDGRKVAAITQLLQIAPALPQVFAPAPGNIDPRQLLLAGAKAAGLEIENFLYDAEGLRSGIQGQVSASAGVIPEVAGSAPPAGGSPPGPTPSLPAEPILEPPQGLPTGPPQIRPGAI